MKNLLLALGLAAGCQAASAQAVAVPFYQAEHFAAGLHQHWTAPRAAAFRAAADDFAQGLAQHCASGNALPAARRQWQAAAQRWDALTAIAVGPLVQRRSLRQIDFQPTRPALIARAIRDHPADLQALARIGTPARGLPALEWLLWQGPPLAPATPACGYAVLLAQEVGVEAQALAQAFDALAATPPQAEDASAAMAEALNQWVGGVERLRWTRMERPVKSAGGKPPAFPRAASGHTRAGWQAAWEGLRSLAATGSEPPPAPGAGLVPLETYLRGRGLNPLADRLAQAVRAADGAMAQADPARPASTQPAARALEKLQRLVEAEVAPALEVAIGFSDSDGD